jgi:hypothetical protein
MRQRPACDFILSGEPDTLFPLHVIEDAIEHADSRRACADPVMETYDHHSPALRALLVKLVEAQGLTKIALRERLPL